MNRSRPTLADVAKAAGVSLATASKALNGQFDVAQATRERVEQASKQIGYVSEPARRRANTPTIEFLVDKLASPFAMEILRGLTLAAEGTGIDVVVGRFRPHGPGNDAEIIEKLANSERMGAIILTAHLSPDTYSAIEQTGLPVVFVDPLRVDNSAIVSVGSTNWIGGRTATEHLISLGHRELAMIAGPTESMSAMARVDGFRSAANAAGISVKPEFIRHALFDFNESLEIATQILGAPEPPTAIFASSELQALGVLEAARKLGLRVPEDLSVVGYDDTSVALWSHPPLTTINQPLQEIGKVCLRTIQQLHAGEKLDSHHIELATRLMVRESTTSPPDRKKL